MSNSSAFSEERQREMKLLSILPWFLEAPTEDDTIFYKH